MNCKGLLDDGQDDRSSLEVKIIRKPRFPGCHPSKIARNHQKFNVFLFFALRCARKKGRAGAHRPRTQFCSALRARRDETSDNPADASFVSRRRDERDGARAAREALSRLIYRYRLGARVGAASGAGNAMARRAQSVQTGLVHPL